MINEYYARRFCKEDISKIKNYDKAIADTTQTWQCHHMTETWWNCTAKELIENECYYNRKACELIFLTPAEHRRIHQKGKHLSEEHRRKLSEVNKGHIVSEKTKKKISETLKGHIFSEETRRKMSEAKKNMSEETRRKISETMKRRSVMKKNLSMRGTK